MTNQNKQIEELLEEIKKLQKENHYLKHLATSLADATDPDYNKITTWIYALEGNRDGVWDWNLITNSVFFSRRWKEMLGYEENEISHHLSEWDTRVHPDDKEAAYADIKKHLEGKTDHYENVHRLKCKNGSYKWILDRGKILGWTEEGKPLRFVGTHTDITLQKEAEFEHLRLIEDLKMALVKIKQLSGLIPICASCKKIRDDKGYWNQLETYIKEHSEADFTHSICPECSEKIFSNYLDTKKQKES